MSLFVASLLALGVPELRRYASERELYRAVGLVEVLASGRPVPSRGMIVDRVDALAKSAARGLPGDPRPSMARGSASLAAHHPSEAREAFCEALRSGERADALLGLGLSEMQAGSSVAARPAFLRAAWISPSLIPRIPDSEKAFVRNEVLRRERVLRAGKGIAIPEAPVAR